MLVIFRGRGVIVEWETGIRTSDVVDILINDNIHAGAGIFVLCYLGDGDGFRHDVCGRF